MPFWRSLDQTLKQVDRNLTGMQESAVTIDHQMEKLAQINAKTDKARQALVSSAGTQFFVSLLVLIIALGGAFVNYKLISLPMSAMVGGGDYITDNLQASEVAAMVIILFETLMGLFLMESLRLTHLFPLSKISEVMRRRMIWFSFGILLTLAGVEVALAVMRDQIVAADIALKQALGSGEAAAVVEMGWVTKIPTAGQMILGFILPFALAFAAIPLEYFVHSARTVVGAGLVMVIRSLAFGLRLLGNLARQIGNALVMMYDVLIFIPLMIERFVTSMRERSEIEGASTKVTSFRKRSNLGSDRTATGSST